MHDALIFIIQHLCVDFRFVLPCSRNLSPLPSQAGDKLPDATVYEGKPDNKVKVRDVFKGKKGVLFGVPGELLLHLFMTILPPELLHYLCLCFNASRSLIETSDCTRET